MLSLTATDYMWFIMIGLSVGWVFYLIFSDRGISEMANIFTGIISAILGGVIFDLMELGVAEAYAALSSILFCYIANMYYYHTKKEVIPKDKHKLSF